MKNGEMTRRSSLMILLFDLIEDLGGNIDEDLGRRQQKLSSVLGHKIFDLDLIAIYRIDSQSSLIDIVVHGGVWQQAGPIGCLYELQCTAQAVDFDKSLRTNAFRR